MGTHERSTSGIGRTAVFDSTYRNCSDSSARIARPYVLPVPEFVVGHPTAGLHLNFERDLLCSTRTTQHSPASFSCMSNQRARLDHLGTSAQLVSLLEDFELRLYCRGGLLKYKKEYVRFAKNRRMLLHAQVSWKARLVYASSAWAHI